MTNRYLKPVPGKGVSIDVYDVLTAFGVTNPATQHAIKKLLMPGQRGAKDVLTDLEEARQSIVRAQQIEAHQRDYYDEDAHFPLPGSKETAR
tara:strand:- start:413 stop:688 length:276 start_codon:yes stop_codon:yes gene_type:complete